MTDAYLQQASVVDHLYLFVDDLSGEAVDRHVHPVTLLALIHILTTDRTQSPKLAEPDGSKPGQALPMH
jgi:hypothetical protein